MLQVENRFCSFTHPCHDKLLHDGFTMINLIINIITTSMMTMISLILLIFFEEQHWPLSDPPPPQAKRGWCRCQPYFDCTTTTCLAIVLVVVVIMISQHIPMRNFATSDVMIKKGICHSPINRFPPVTYVCDEGIQPDQPKYKPF